jgi:hypothetical protein
MSLKLFNSLLLFSLFGISLGFFGMLYEGMIYLPGMLDVSAGRMQFWHGFYEVIKPFIYYIPAQLGSLILVILYFTTDNRKRELKRTLKYASLFQILALTSTFYIVKQIDLQLCFSDVEKYKDLIPGKVVLANVVSVFRIVIAGTAMAFVLKAYVQAKKEVNA